MKQIAVVPRRLARRAGPISDPARADRARQGGDSDHTVRLAVEAGERFLRAVSGHVGFRA
jgi:hypothetical protein